jgi:hypothetical protein
VAVRRTLAATAAATQVSTKRAVVAAATVTRATMRRAVAHLRGHALPALAHARRVAANRFAAAGRFRRVLWSWRPDRRSLTIALTIAVVVGLSGGVIAARGASSPARVLTATSPAPAARPAGAVGVMAPRAAASEPSPSAPPAIQPPTAPADDAVTQPPVEQPAVAKHPRPRQRGQRASAVGAKRCDGANLHVVGAAPAQLRATVDRARFIPRVYRSPSRPARR